MMIAAEAALTETRETVEALTVSALQEAHEMSRRPETTAESFFQAHKDVQRASSSETDRFPGEHESLRRGVRGRVACWNTRHVWLAGGHDENANSLEIQVPRERLLRSKSKNSGHPHAPGEVSRET